MQVTVKTAALAAAAVLGTVSAAWAVPTVSGVTMMQRAGTRIVDIGYTVADEAAIVTLSIETNGVAIPDSAVTRLTGEVCKVVQPGSYSIVWNAGADWPENVTETAKARVTAWSLDAPPQVMVINLTGGPLANTYPVAYYTSTAALPGGVTNVIYKSSYLVMRKITQGEFNMGDGICAVSLTNDFYMGVFEVTQGQWFQVTGGLPAFFYDVPSHAFRPVEQISYQDIRGAAPAVNWPVTGRDVVSAESFLGILRAKTGLTDVDLPTEAQWEYACRATTTSCFNDGDGDANVSGVNNVTNAWLDVLGRYQYNGGYVNGTIEPLPSCGPANGTASVGSYLPNTWGLYDMHGNVWEWCLDWCKKVWTDPLIGGVDPQGASSGTRRVIRGGGYDNTAEYCRSVARYPLAPSARNNGSGFRLTRTMP